MKPSHQQIRLYPIDATEPAYERYLVAEKAYIESLQITNKGDKPRYPHVKPSLEVELMRIHARHDLDKAITSARRAENLWHLVAGVVFIAFAVWFVLS